MYNQYRASTRETRIMDINPRYPNPAHIIHPALTYRPIGGIYRMAGALARGDESLYDSQKTTPIKADQLLGAHC